MHLALCPGTLYSQAPTAFQRRLLGRTGRMVTPLCGRGCSLPRKRAGGLRRIRRSERIGALAGFLDYRDGANYTGLNPEHRQYVRRIGITGHQSSAVLMSALRRDSENVIDALLVARGVGKTDAVAYSDLVRCRLSLPGVAVAIIGTGLIGRDRPGSYQLAANRTAALKDVPSELERARIEKETQSRHGTAANYFQEKANTLVQPTGANVKREGDRVIVRWNIVFAGPEPADVGRFAQLTFSRTNRSRHFKVRPGLSNCTVSTEGLPSGSATSTE